MSEKCSDCGEEFESEHGVNIHQSQSDCGGDDGDEWTEFEQRVIEREGGECKKCEDAQVDTIHKIDDEPREETKIVNYAGLCSECNEEISNLATAVKRTIIKSSGENESTEEDRTPWYERDPYVSGRGPRSGNPSDN